MYDIPAPQWPGRAQGWTWQALSSRWEVDVPFLVECFEQWGQSNLDLAFGQSALNLLPYRFIQGRSNHRLMVLIILHDLTIGKADEQLYPPINEGAHDGLVAQPGTHLTS